MRLQFGELNITPMIRSENSHTIPLSELYCARTVNKDYVEYVIQDYNKPMGVATYKTFDDMPEELRKALPNMDDLTKLLK